MRLFLCFFEAVFAGWGISAPERGYDDYAGLDVRGKIVVCFQGAPPSRASALVEQNRHRARQKTARARGAAGILYIQTGVAGSRAIHPTATNPWLHRTIDVTRLSGSSGSRRRQRSPVHAPDGGRAVVKATGSGPMSAGTTTLGALGVAVGSGAGGV